MKKRRLLTSVICSLVGINSMLMADSARPRLVVSIVVDQLRTDYIEYLRRHFGEKGFNMLINRAAYLRDVDFGLPAADAVSATALAVTGSYPSANGVTSARRFDRATGIESPALQKSDKSGRRQYSPENLLLSTISDEVAIDGIGLGAIYSLAVDPQISVVLGGHAPTSAVWLDEETGRWASSDAYGPLPMPVTMLNRNASPAAKLDTMRWEPAMKLADYPGIPAQKRYYPFRHTFPLSDRDAYRRWSASPLANREITDMAVEYLRQLKPGSRGDAIDMLSIAYTAAPYKYVKDGDCRLELEDTYIRLDGQLARLFEAIDAGPGLDNTVVYLTSTGYYDDAVADDAKYKLPGGDFSMKRASSLLNSFLSARYGNGNYVSAFRGPNIYLDHSLLESKGIEPERAAEAARDFLSKMSGVRSVSTLSGIISESTPDLAALRRVTDVATAGDLYVDFQPGWNVVDDTRFPVQTKQIRSSMVSTPAFIMAPGVAPSVVSAPVDARRLAPTVTQILRIRSPNGAQLKPLTL